MNPGALRVREPVSTRANEELKRKRFDPWVTRLVFRKTPSMLGADT